MTLHPKRGALQRAGIALLIGISLFIGAPLTCVAVPRLNDFVYKHLGYRVIANRLGGESATVEDLLRNTVEFVNEHVYPLGPIVDDTTWTDLVRSAGYCDQQARDVARLLAEHDIPARIIMDAGRAHAVGEALIEGRWRFYDAQHNYLFRTAQGELATFEEVGRGLAYSPKYEADRLLLSPARWEDYDQIIPDYQGVVIDPNQGKQRWAPLTSAAGPVRRFVIGWTEAVFRLVPGFAARYQDLYLAVHPKLSLVERGRHYEIYERGQPAEALYRRALIVPALREDALFFLGRMLVAQHRYEEGIAELSRLLRESPDTLWREPAWYFLGESYRLTGQLDAARNCYGQVTTSYLNAAHRLSQLAPPNSVMLRSDADHASASAVR